MTSTSQVLSEKTPVKSETKAFRKHARRFYSQLLQRLTPESAIFQLQNKHYVIGDELHENGNRHFHVILISRHSLCE